MTVQLEQTPEVGRSSDGRDPRDVSAGAAALPGEQESFDIVCPNCRSLQSPEDAFCTNCGEHLLHATPQSPQPPPVSEADTISPPAADVPPQVASLSVTERGARERPETPPVPSSRWGRWSLSRVAAIAAIGAAVCFALLWRVEVGHHSATRSDLRVSQANVFELRNVQAKLASQLAQTQRLSERRAAVLRRTKAVLASVDPLLSSVDELQSLTGKIQSARDNASSASNTLVSDLLSLSNYLIQAGQYVDYTYVLSLISTVRSDLDTVNGYYGQLQGYDSGYNTASDRFGARATTLSKNVRALNSQLTALAG